MKLDTAKLRDLIGSAQAAADAVDPGPDNDGGTANLDSIVVFPPKGTRRAAMEDLGFTGPLSGWMWKGGWFAPIKSNGQGFRRTAMTEAAHKVLKAGADGLGIKVSMYYQMD